MMNLREEAYSILKKVMCDAQFSNLSLRKLKETYSAENMAFITQLVYGTLENDLFVRYQWSIYCDKMPEEALAVLLDMATYELLFLNSAHYAVINEAVELSKSFPHKRYASFVNSVLRKISQNGRQEVNLANKEEAMSVTYSVPLWIIKLWQKQYGEETAERILKALHTPAKQYLRVNTLKVSVEDLIREDPKFTAYKEEAVTYEGNYLRTDYFKNGCIFPQDYHSQLVSTFADLKNDMKILDRCAAPGTKTLHMSALLHNTGSITAVDLYPKRAELIKEGALKAGCTNIEVLAFDGREVKQHFPIGSFDVVFVDAPCSGLGVLRHKPEIKRTVTPEGLDAIEMIQRELLDASAEMVKPGGSLIYSTCTLNKKENEKQADRFLLLHPEFEMIKKQTLFPFEDEADGFFMVKLQKKQ